MPKLAETDLYATLGVSPSATTTEIAAAFRAHAKESHPDRHGGDPAKTEHFKALTNAYDVLIRPTSRAAYDRRRIALARGDTLSTSRATQHPIFKTARSARIALWAGVSLVIFGLAGIAVLASVDTGDAAKAITLWLVVVKLVVCGAILWGIAAWRLRQPGTSPSVTPQ